MQPEDFNSFDSTVYATPVMKRSQAIPSRLAKREQTKVVRQTVAIIAISLVVLIGFLFVVVPTVIRLAIGGGTTSVFQADTIAPQIPVISAPPAAVSTKEITISGYGEPLSDIRSVLNNEEGPSIFASEDGAFEIVLQLQENINTLSLFSIDEAKNESSLSREYEVLSLTTAPKFVIIEPTADQVFETTSNQNISIKGESNPKVKIYVNDRLFMVNAQGIFSGSLRLNEGDNELKFRAVDLAGNEVEQTLKVAFRY